MRSFSFTLLVGASIAAGCADPSLAARTAARAEAWRRAWRERHEAALARDCHRGYLIGGDDRPQIASTRVVTEVALTAPATALWSGLDFVCASTEGGGRSCWGVNDLAPDA